MKTLDLTLPSPAQNLALDEALLDRAEEHLDHGILRFWEPADYFAVLGYSCKIQDDIYPDACRKDHIPVLRRPSGGGTVLQGPGCLNYALILPLDQDPAFRRLDETNQLIMKRHRDAVQPLDPRPILQEGITDLTAGGRKFSGNAQRRKKRFLLFHGTFLLGLDTDRMSRYLTAPPRQPAYRASRPHGEFLTHLNCTAAAVKKVLCQAWGALDKLENVPLEMTAKLVKDKYSRDDWNLKF